MRKYIRLISASVYQKPARFVRELFSKKNLKAFADQLYDPNQSDERKALSASLGICIGIMPVWGLQTVAAIFLAMLFKLNKSLVVIFSQVSFPPVFPLIILLSYRVGRLWVSGPVNANAHAGTFGGRFEQYIYGSITLAVIAAAVTGILTFAWLKLFRYIRQYRMAVRVRKSPGL